MTSHGRRVASQNYLYLLAVGLSQIVGYRVGPDRSLTQVTTAPAFTDSYSFGPAEATGHR